MITSQQIGPYRIVQLLGKGGMGSVFEAIQEPIGRRVAIKMLLPQHAQDREVVSRFFNEACAVNMIEHPSIVQVSDYGHAPDGTAYLVMELLRGEMLRSRLDSLHPAGQRLPVVAAVQIASQLADALAATHDKGIVHRDLKPSNIMVVLDSAVSGGSRVKLFDFGIAKLMHGQSQHTATQAVMGTPQYMSPEQCAGSGGVDDRTDVYALGVILYEMLAGQRPFNAETPLEYLAQHASTAPPPLAPLAPLASPDLVAIVHRMLVKDKLSRPSMRTVGDELCRLLATGTSSQQAVTLQPEPDHATRLLRQREAPLTLGIAARHPLKRIWQLPQQPAVAIATVAGIGLVLLLFTHLHSEPAPNLPSPYMPTISTGAAARSITAAPTAAPPSGKSAVDPTAQAAGLGTAERSSGLSGSAAPVRRTLKRRVKYVD